MRAFNHFLGESTSTLLAPAALAPAMRRSFPAGLEAAPLLLPTPGCALRRSLDDWFERSGIRPEIVAEAQDSALLKAFAADGMGAMFVPTVIAGIVSQRYGLVEVAEVETVRERFNAISSERRLIHPAVVAIRTAARHALFT